MSPNRLKSFFHLGAVIAITAIAGIISGSRMEHRGMWLPEVPSQIATWTAIDVPLEAATVKILGNPRTLGRQYKNPFDETVDAHVIAADSFDAYHEPAMCMSGYGFTLTGQLFPELFGKGNTARAMVLKHEDSGVKVLMLFWVQYEDGTTSGIGDLHSAADAESRFKVGWNAVANNKQCVIVRAYTRIAPNDVSGAQARRNLWEVSRGIYEGIKKDGSVWRQRDKKMIGSVNKGDGGAV